MRTRLQAFTLIEFLVVVTALALITALLLPSRARVHSGGRQSCMNNLRVLGLAFRTWEGDYGDMYPARYFTNADGSLKFADAANAFRSFQVMSNEINNPLILLCPQDTKRKAAPNWETGLTGANISYFVGLDADETMPTRFLSGDRNLTNGVKLNNGILDLTTNHTTGWTTERHQGFGNVLFADGSVKYLDTNRLNDAIAKTGLATNRLAMP